MPDIKCTLKFIDGTTYEGFTNSSKSTKGEVVFNTSMFGYQEMITDPSYYGQILVLTAPHIGVTGINKEDCESKNISVSGLIVSDLSPNFSNWRADKSLLKYLTNAKVPVGWGFDTRAIVLHIREYGSLSGILICSDKKDNVDTSIEIDKHDLSRINCESKDYEWTEASWKKETVIKESIKIVVIDCGCKYSILRKLIDTGVVVTVVPPWTDADTILKFKPDGIVISNGPGDPRRVADVSKTIYQLLGKVPILGICLGHQLLALALNGEIYKLPFGHHGANHPVKDMITGAVYITSQNHNYCLRRDSIRKHTAQVTMTNLIDSSIEGIASYKYLAWGIQFHPEASPGPHDTSFTFQIFMDCCKKRKQ